MTAAPATPRTTLDEAIVDSSALMCILMGEPAAPLFITQNDGTVVEAAQARRLPVYSFASGATNSMRGAAYLSGMQDATVIDVGGTTTDVGQLRNGFPREANSVVQVGGVRTLFRMPDLLSIGLGGGSHVVLDPLKVGPVIAEGRWISGKRRVFVADARLIDADGEEAARGTGTFMRSRIALAGLPGYRAPA